MGDVPATILTANDKMVREGNGFFPPSGGLGSWPHWDKKPTKISSNFTYFLIDAGLMH